MLIIAFISEALEEIKSEEIKAALSITLKTGSQAFSMNKLAKINRSFFISILSAFSDLDASISEQIGLRKKSSITPAHLFYLFHFAIITTDPSH